MESELWFLIFLFFLTSTEGLALTCEEGGGMDGRLEVPDWDEAVAGSEAREITTRK